MKSIGNLVRWAKWRVGPCDCAGGCQCHQKRLRVLSDYRTGLRAAWREVRGPSLANVEALMSKADEAVRREKAKHEKAVDHGAL